MINPGRKYRLRAIGMVFVLGISVASYIYMASIDKSMKMQEDPVLVEELREEKSELLPDVQIIKAIMQRTLDFMSVNQPF